MSNLPYTDKEICKSYTQNPTKEQIKRLSELNDCKTSEIIHILSTYGILNKEFKFKNRKYKPKPIVIRHNKNNSLVMGYIKKRKLKLEFMSLCFPERQREWIDEMQELRNLIDRENG